MSDGFEFSGGGLLDDIEVPAAPGILTKGLSAESKMAHDAWRVWASTTGRPDGKSTNDKFYRTYLDQLRVGRSHEYLLDVVRGAARMPVNPKNQDDTRRVINALKTLTTGRTAVSALHSDHPVIAYPYGDSATLLASTEDVARACRIPPSGWGEHDQDAAGILIETFDAEQIEEAAAEASHSLGTDAVLPTDVLRAARSRKVSRGQAAAGARARETYSSGMAERARLKEVAFSLDDLAKRMLLDGAPDAEIVRVHQMAPEGYWSAVFELAADGDSNDEAYKRLLDQFDNWHPSSRVPVEV